MKHAKKVVLGAGRARRRPLGLAACGSSDERQEPRRSAASSSCSPGAPAAGYEDVSGEATLERADGGTTVSLNAERPRARTPSTSPTSTPEAATRPIPAGRTSSSTPAAPTSRRTRSTSSSAPTRAGSGKAEASSDREVPAGEAGSVVLHEAEADHKTSGGAASAKRSGTSSTPATTTRRRARPRRRSPAPNWKAALRVEAGDGRRKRQHGRLGPDHRRPQRRTGRRHPGARIRRRRRDPLRGQLRRRRRGPRPRLRPDRRTSPPAAPSASTSRPKSKASSRSSWRAARSRSRSCGSTRELAAVRARAGRPAGPADPGLAVRLGGVDRPDRLLLRALGRLAQAPLRGGALAPARGGALPRSARSAGAGPLRPGRRLPARRRRLRRPARHRSAGPQLRPHLPLRHHLARLPLLLGPARRRLPALQPVARGRPRRRGRLPGDRRPAPRPPRLPASGWAAGRRRSACSPSSGWRSSTAPAAASPSASTRTRPPSPRSSTAATRWR